MTTIWDEIRCTRALTPDRREAFLAHHGERGRKALKTVDERRVKRYCDFFVVVGYNDEYVVDEEFCTCSDFLFRGKECAHLLAVRLACATGCYERYDTWYYPSLRR